MNRRAAIRNVIILSAGATFLPSCLQHEKTSVPLKNISVTVSQNEMLAELTEAIIPKTKNFVGAKDLQTNEFILTMVDDCTNPEDRKKFMQGMKMFEKICDKKWGSSFVKCTPKQQNELLRMVESKQGVHEDALKFYGIVKRYTVQSFTSSKEYMTGVRKYKMVPGADFKGCVHV